MIAKGCALSVEQIDVQLKRYVYESELKGLHGLTACWACCIR